MDYPDLIEPLPLRVIFPGNWAAGQFSIAVGIFLERTNQNQMEQRHIYGISRIEMGQLIRDVKHVIYSVNMQI